MESYISILRGINVSGYKKMNMKALKSLYEELGLQRVQTYIQSGNVLFECPPANAKELSKLIEEKITEKYDFEVPVIIRTVAELDKIRSNNPFLQKPDIQTAYLHATFLADEPNRAAIDQVQAFECAPDEFIISGKEVYVFCPNGYGRTKLTNTFFENKLNATATTRNWKTVTTLVEMAQISSPFPKS